MTVDLTTLPDPSTLPIPDDVQPNDRWSPLMVEIADHIGARATLELLVRFGGQELRIPIDPARSPFAVAVGATATAEISRVFGGEVLKLPTGRSAVLHARRQGILAQVRAGALTLADAARRLRTSRRELTRLINQTNEGSGSAPPPKPRPRDTRQIDMFD